MSNTLGQQPRRSKRIADQLDIVDHQMKAKRRRVHDDNRGGFDKKVSLLLRAAVSPQIAELGLSGGSRSSNTVPSKFGKTRKPAERTGEGAEATDNKRQHHKSGGIRWAHSVQSITSGPAPKKSRAESVVRRIGSAVGSGDRAPVGKGRKGRTTRQTCSHDDEGMKWNAVEGGRVRVKPLDKVGVDPLPSAIGTVVHSMCIVNSFGWCTRKVLLLRICTPHSWWQALGLVAITLDLVSRSWQSTTTMRQWWTRHVDGPTG